MGAKRCKPSIGDFAVFVPWNAAGFVDSTIENITGDVRRIVIRLSPVYRRMHGAHAIEVKVSDCRGEWSAPKNTK